MSDCDYLIFDIPFFEIPQDIRFWVLQKHFVFKVYGIFNTHRLFNIDDKFRFLIQSKESYKWELANLTLNHFALLQSIFIIPENQIKHTLFYNITISNGTLKKCCLKKYISEVDTLFQKQNFFLSDTN